MFEHLTHGQHSRVNRREIVTLRVGVILLWMSFGEKIIFETDSELFGKSTRWKMLCTLRYSDAPRVYAQKFVYELSKLLFVGESYSVLFFCSQQWELN